MANATTLRRRIAAVAVAALAVGAVQAVPAFAATSATPFRVTDAYETVETNPASITATQIAGANNFITLGFTSGNGYNETFSGSKSGFLSVTGGTFSSTSIVNASLDAAATTATLSSPTAATSVRLLTPAAGTITVKFIVRTWTDGVASDSTKQTITVTAIAAVPSSLFDHAKLGSLGNLGATTYADSASVVYAPRGTAGSAAKVADFTVTQWADADETVKTATASTKAVTASISGPGLLAQSGGATTTYLSLAAGAANDQVVEIYNDGRAGVAIVTITVNGVTVGTRSVTFYGPASQYSVSVTNANIPVGGTGTIKVTAKDANGVVVPTATIYAKSSATSKATVTGTAGTAVSTSAASLGVATFTVTGVAAGAVTVTFSNATTDATVTATGAVNVSAASPTTVTVTFDKSSYSPGEKATLTVTATDKDGSVQGDGTYANLFAAALTSSVALGGSLPTASVDLSGGKATYTVYMPLAAGPITVSGKLGTGVVTASQGTAASATASVVATEDPQITAAKTAAEAAKAEAAKATAAVAAVQASITAIQTAISTLVASFTSTLLVLQANLNKVMKKLGIK